MTWTILHAKLHTHLKHCLLLPRRDRILIALSGGQDSVCLTQLLIDLQPHWHWQLAIAHCDHGWSMDAGLVDRVKSLADHWQLPFYRESIENLPETEAAARQWRYSVLGKIADREGFTTLVTGHTQSDRAETFLFNLMRGAGSQGLSALNWERSLTETCRLVRPLLAISRKETGDFCQKLALCIWDDAANQDSRFARSRLRSQLIPLIKQEFNPKIEQSLAQTAEILRAEADYLDQQTRFYSASVSDRDLPRLHRPTLRSLPLALQRRIIRVFLQQWLDHAPNFEKIEAIVQLIDAPQRSRTPSLAAREFAEVEGDWIILKKTP